MCAPLLCLPLISWPTPADWLIVTIACLVFFSALRLPLPRRPGETTPARDTRKETPHAQAR